MAIYGIQTDRTNPTTYTKSDFTFWMPQFQLFFFTTSGTERQDTDVYWTKLYPIVNNKIFKSVFGTDWELAMSLCLAHYLTLISNQQQAPSGSTLGEIAGGGVTKGVLTSANIGGFQKSYDLQYSMINKEEAFFWNQTSYGTQLLALYKSKGNNSIFVVTNGPEYPEYGNLHLRKRSGY